jgi:hypothetical protein
MSSFFKKIGKGISSITKKAPVVAQSIFKKVGNVAGQVSSGLGKVGDVLGKVSDVGSQILGNPLVEGAASAFLGPEAGVGLGLAAQGLRGVSKLSNLAKTGSSISGQFGRGADQLSQGNVMGGVGEIRGSIQRARDTAGTTGPIFA